MTAKKKAEVSTISDAQTLNVKDQKGKSKERKVAEVLLSPTTLNTFTIEKFISSFTGKVDLTEAVEVMNEKSEKIIAGDLSELESTLIAQVVSLNTIFNTLARQSAHSMGNNLQTLEVYMRLALKAQAQCARTIEVLATIKNPPIVYVKQANIAHGHQQINNHIEPTTHAGKTVNFLNELLSEANHATLDIRGKIETSSADQELATVETLNGS